MLPKPHEGRSAPARVLQEGSLYALCVLLPFSKASVEIAFVGLLLGWLLEHARRGGWRTSLWSRPAARWLLLALGSYLAVCALSIPISTFPALSARGFISKTTEYAFFFLIAADLAQHHRVARRCASLMFASALLVGCDALWQLGFGHDAARGYGLDVYGRITGPYENPNDLATYLAVVTCVALGQLAPAKRWRRVWLLVVLLLTLGCLVLTAAHGAWLGLAVAVGAMAWLGRRLRGWSLVLGGVTGIFVAVFQKAIRDPSVVGMRDRWLMWQAAWAMWLERPLMGHGLNTFMANYLTYRRGGERMPRYAHNCYLQVAAETGLMGLLAFLWFLGTALAVVVRRIRQMAEDESRYLLVGLFGGLMAFLVQAAVDTNFYSLRQAALFWTLAGLAVGCAWSSGDAADRTAALPDVRVP